MCLQVSAQASHHLGDASSNGSSSVLLWAAYFSQDHSCPFVCESQNESKHPPESCQSQGPPRQVVLGHTCDIWWTGGPRHKSPTWPSMETYSIKRIHQLFILLLIHQGPAQRGAGSGLPSRWSSDLIPLWTESGKCLCFGKTDLNTDIKKKNISKSTAFAPLWMGSRLSLTPKKAPFFKGDMCSEPETRYLYPKKTVYSPLSLSDNSLWRYNITDSYTGEINTSFFSLAIREKAVNVA